MSFTACRSYISVGCSIAPSPSHRGRQHRPRCSPFHSKWNLVVEGRLAAVRLRGRRDRLDAADTILRRILSGLVLFDLDVDAHRLVEEHGQVGDRATETDSVGDVLQLAPSELHRFGGSVGHDDLIPHLAAVILTALDLPSHPDRLTVAGLEVANHRVSDDSDIVASRDEIEG